MNNIFSKIIIMLTVFVGVPVFAQMQCDDWGNCTGTYSFPSTGGGASTPPANTGVTQGGGISPEAAAQRAAAEKAGKIAACKHVKEGIPNDITDCQKEVDYKRFTTTCPGSTGTFDWNFAYTNGKFFTMSVKLPPQQYDNRNMPGTLSCAYLASVSGTLTSSKCETEANIIVNTVCKGL